jgi:AcrR family transcriptional regulator
MERSVLLELMSGGRGLSERHREVLRHAMQLIAERGYRGASLRELARRVGMRQPSLYHYFESKSELVEQIIQTFGVGGSANDPPPEFPLPSEPTDAPQAIAALVAYLYDHTDWPTFVRFVFQLAFEAPEHAPRLRAMFTETSDRLFRAAVRPWAERGELSEDELVHVCRMVANAVGLAYMEERLVFPGEPRHGWLGDYVAFVVRFTTEGILRARRVP